MGVSNLFPFFKKIGDTCGFQTETAPNHKGFVLGFFAELLFLTYRQFIATLFATSSK